MNTGKTRSGSTVTPASFSLTKDNKRNKAVKATATSRQIEPESCAPPPHLLRPNMTQTKASHFAHAFCGALNHLMPGWSVADEAVMGPDDVVIRFSEEHCADSDGHMDVSFGFRDSDPHGLRLWDCVSGFGETIADCASSAAHLWGATSAPALLELKYSRSGHFADHFHGHELNGLTGWHCICGAVMGYGTGGSGAALQDWWISKQTVLPAISASLSDLSDDLPHAIKIFFGGPDVAEVRVDGEIHERASSTLLSLDWPRMEPFGFLRVFVIALHRE